MGKQAPTERNLCESLKKDASKVLPCSGAAEGWSWVTHASRGIPMRSEHLIQGRTWLSEEAEGWAWRILPRASMSTPGTNKRAISLISSTFCGDIINTIMAWVWGPSGDTLSSCPEWIAHQVLYLLCFLLLSPIRSYSSLLSLLLLLMDEWTPDSSWKLFYPSTQEKYKPSFKWLSSRANLQNSKSSIRLTFKGSMGDMHIFPA